jgi:MFS family permease
VSGLFLTPLMGGVLVASITSGIIISRVGRYKVFPIVGTGVTAFALFLLSRLTVSTPGWEAALFMVAVGLGLGLVMQVLVLAVQNSVDYKHLGVATSGSTLFRQVGGSIGVAAFGAIFANRLRAELLAHLPPGVQLPTAANPAAIRRLPPAVHAPYIQAFTASLRPVFIFAAGVAVLAFVLSWMLREIPLRKTSAASDKIGAAAPTAGR